MYAARVHAGLEKVEINVVHRGWCAGEWPLIGLCQLSQLFFQLGHCRYLNVWTPEVAPTTVPTEAQPLLPVMVFIHGGCWKYGNVSKYDGSDLVAFRKDIVVVTLEYSPFPSHSRNLDNWADMRVWSAAGTACQSLGECPVFRRVVIEWVSWSSRSTPH